MYRVRHKVFLWILSVLFWYSDSSWAETPTLTSTASKAESTETVTTEETSKLNSTASTALNSTASTALNSTASTALNSTASTTLNSTASTALYSTASTALNSTASTALNSTASTALNSTASTALNSTASTALNSTASTAESTETATTEGNKPEEISTTLIIVIAASAGAVVGVTASILVTVILYKRRTRNTGCSKRPSVKKNLSYRVTCDRNHTRKVESAYIKIDPVLYPGPHTDVDTKQGDKTTDKTGNRMKSLVGDYDSVYLEETDVQPVYLEETGVQPPTPPHTPDVEYSHLKTTARKISNTNYSHVVLNRKSNVAVDERKISGTKEGFINSGYQDNSLNDSGLVESMTEDDYDHIDKNDDNDLPTVEDPGAEDGYSHAKTFIPGSSVDESDSESDVDETYNHLSTLKKFNNVNFKKHRSNSLPAKDLNPNIRILDEEDPYDNISDEDLNREPSYYNWKPMKYVKSKSLPATENFKYVVTDDFKVVERGAPNDTKQRNDMPRRKNAVAMLYPVLENLHNHKRENVSKLESKSNMNGLGGVIDANSPDFYEDQVTKPEGKRKQSIFTIQENENKDDLPHSYFILEPTTVL